MKRILITGASGMFGATLVHELSKYYDVFATGNTSFKEQPEHYMKFDLSSSSYESLIDWANPDIIIHSGALTNGNFCSENPSLAFDVNGVSMKKFLDKTNDNVKIVYISTDAVFPSTLSMANEKDCVNPENVYGKSKELGEFFLKNSDREFTIIRTTIVGLNRNSDKQGFVEWIINSSLKKEQIGLFEDVIFTPISIWDLTNEINFLISNNQINSEILHIGGANTCTKYDFGIALLKELNIDDSVVKKSSILNFSDRAKRCTDQTMETKHYREKYSRKLPDLADTVKSIKENYNE